MSKMVLFSITCFPRAFHGCQRKLKPECRPHRFHVEPEFSVEGLRNRFRNREPKPRSRDPMTIFAASIESIKDSVPLVYRNLTSLVPDRQNDAGFRNGSRNSYRGSR